MKLKKGSIALSLGVILSINIDCLENMREACSVLSQMQQNSFPCTMSSLSLSLPLQPRFSLYLLHIAIHEGSRTHSSVKDLHVSIHPIGQTECVCHQQLLLASFHMVLLRDFKTEQSETETHPTFEYQVMVVIQGAPLRVW